MATESALAELDSVLREGGTSNEVGDVARDCTAAWETTLKAADPAWAGSYLAPITNELRGRGWSGADSLDIIRRANNAAKHASTDQMRGDEILRALSTLAASIPELSALVPGINNDQGVDRKRTIIVAIYDFFAQGEIDITFYSASPADTWMTVNKLDNVQIEVKDEKAAFAWLETLTGWRWDPPEFNALASSLRESDNELWKLAIFTDSYEKALQGVVPFQHSMDLIKGLHREDDTTNVVVTLAALQAKSWNQYSVLLDAATLSANAAVELHGRQVDIPRLAELVTELFTAAASSKMMGSITVDRASVAKFRLEQTKSPLAVSEHIGALINREGTVLVYNLS